MEYTLTIHSLAAEDILEIARWYDLQLAGLGNRFGQQLEIAFSYTEKPHCSQQSDWRNQKSIPEKISVHHFL